MSAVAATTVLAGAAEPTYSVTLAWSPATSGGLPVTYYQVFRGGSPTSLTQIGSSVAASYVDNSLSPATTYYYALKAGDSSGDLSTMSAPIAATTGGGQTSGLFNLLPMKINSFSPSSTVLPGLPQTQINSTLYDDVGYQSGVVVNGKVIYNANEIWMGGAGSWMGTVDSAVPMPVFLSYDASQQLTGFDLASNWTWFDSSTLSWWSKGTPQSGNTGKQCLAPSYDLTCVNIAGAYMGRSAVVGNIYYPTPDYHNAYMVFLSYDTSKAINDPTAYQTFVPPGYLGSPMGQQYGWCSSITDGRFVYYAPLGNPVNGKAATSSATTSNGAFSNPLAAFRTAGQNFDMAANVSQDAVGFLGSAYDGYRYVYFIPFSANLIVRYDTWNGGSGPDPDGFTVASNYVTFDPPSSARQAIGLSREWEMLRILPALPVRKWFGTQPTRMSFFTWSRGQLTQTQPLTPPFKAPRPASVSAP